MDERLQRLLGGDELASLRQRLRRHFERRDDGMAADVLQLARLNLREHSALAQLTGRPGRAAQSARLNLASLDASLQAAGIAASLRDALEQLDGPIASRAALRATEAATWLEVTSAGGVHPLLGDWLRQPQATALLKRLSRQDAMTARTLLARADAVLRRLPQHGMPRAQLAANVLGNAHGLDTGQAVATLVLAAWRWAEPLADADEERDPERARDTWARAGVLVNELARPALALNLPGGGTPGEPAYLSLRQLLRSPPTWAVAGARIFVCENPNVVCIAADQLGTGSAPLVCTDGMPAAAQRTLLQQLVQAGARLHYHGDFDWPGLRIAQHVLSTYAATAWRMDADDYEAAVGLPAFHRHPLTGPVAEAPWDPLLAPAMSRHGAAVAEEAVAGNLLDDLAHGRAPAAPTT